MADARAQHRLQGTVPGSARAAARWLAEAAEQLRTVHRCHRNLQRHTDHYPSPTASGAADSVAAFVDRLENDYRHGTRRSGHTTAAGQEYGRFASLASGLRILNRA